MMYNIQQKKQSMQWCWHFVKQQLYAILENQITGVSILNAIRIISLVLGAACIILFIPPLVMYRILNLGNATGLIAGVVFLINGVFAGKVNALLANLWRNTPGRVLVSGVFSVIILAVIMAIIISFLMLNAALKEPEGDETLIVLGCQVKGTSPSLMLTERLEAARTYLDEHEDACCILSGGQGPDEGISEAQCMYDYLTAHGVSADRLFMEDSSTSTRENLQYSLEIMEENKLGKKAAIVTNEFHEYRAFKIAEKLDINVSAVPAKTHWWLFSTYFVREWYGVIYEWTGMKK